MPSRFRPALAGLVVALMCIAPARALDTQRSVTLREALGLVAARHPRLAAQSSARAALERRAELEALPSVGTLDLQLENFAGTGNLSGGDAVEATLQISRAIDLGGKAALRRGVGDAALAQLDARQRSQRLDLLAEAARRFVHVLADQEQLAAALRSEKLAEDALAAVRARVTAGAASPAARSRAEISLARTRIEREHAEHELESSRVSLAATWGAEEPDFTAAEGDLFAWTLPEPLETYTGRLEQNSELLEFASDRRVLAARARLMDAQRRPSPVVTFGIRHLAPLDEQALVAGVSLPLGARRRASLEASALESEQRENGLGGEARRIELRATLFALYQEILHASTEAGTITREIQPEATRMLRAVEAGYRAGRFSLIELADAQRQLLEVERDRIRAAAEFHTNLIEIERLTGVSLLTYDVRTAP